MSEWLLPLFPLNVVLFPRTDLPLHIFEERYKQMIAECLEARREFGVLLANEGSLANTGCAAAIRDVVKRYDDGRMDIVVQGSRRFAVLLLNEEMSYLRGSPQFFDDEDATPPADDSRRAQAMQLFGQLAEMLGAQGAPTGKGSPEPGDAQLSFQIMARLPVELDFKQSLLPLRSEEERLTLVVSYLEKLLEQLALAIKARAIASGNGKGRR